MEADFATASTYHSEAYAIINLVRAKWPREIESGDCGVSMRRTFSEYRLSLTEGVLIIIPSERSVGARVLACNLRLAQTKGSGSLDLNNIEELAQDQLESCEIHPIPRPADDASDSEFACYIAFDAYIRAEVSNCQLGVDGF